MPESKTKIDINLRSSDYKKEIFDKEKGNIFIKNMLLSPSPVMISRHGSVELRCIVDYINDEKWSEPTKKHMRNNAGFFPIEDKYLNKFAELYLDSTKEIDLLGVWFNSGEDYVTNTYSPNADLIHLRGLEPFNASNPWTEILKNKKVLVIHPFEESIKKQHKENRKKLFEDKRILPDFDLITLKAVQTVGGNTSGFHNWFEAYEYMCEQISKLDYDIAIIGAGAYGLPLAAYIKKTGKKAFHLGGVTQLLFGIKGQRWHNDPSIVFNENWVNPTENERPQGYKLIESGCYW